MFSREKEGKHMIRAELEYEVKDSRLSISCKTKEELKVYDELRDIDSKAAALWDLAQIELQRESGQTAFYYLTESYAINLKLGRLDGICFVGLFLGQLLCGAGNTEEGLDILKRSREGFEKLGQNELAAQAEKIIEHFSIKK